MFTEEEFSKICNIAMKYGSDGIFEKTYDEFGYNIQSSQLINQLNIPVDKNDYLGSPFVLYDKMKVFKYIFKKNDLSNNLIIYFFG